MDETHLYQQIAESIRREILEGRLKPGDRLPSVRQLCEQWNCTPGTVQRAYHELSREGLLSSKAGRGTQVAGTISQARTQAQGTLRRANLVHRSESFLLDVITTGYALDEIQQALDLAMDRWRSLDSLPEKPSTRVLRFAGSHDMIMNEIAHHVFGKIIKDAALQLSYNGSLGGLISLVQGKCDLAGCHLWDAETDSYNLPFIKRLLPGKDVIVVRLATRRQGLILAPGNPLNIQGLADLIRPEVTFVNRQPGSGTRVWLDATLHNMNIQPTQIHGYANERLNHTDVARLVAEGQQADVGLGLENAAHAYGLDFIFLNREKYDLVLPAEIAAQSPAKDLLVWLASADGKQFVGRHPGYEGETTGQIQPLD